MPASSHGARGSPRSHTALASLSWRQVERLLGEEFNRSLLPLIRGEAQPPRPIFIQFDGNGARGNFQRCVIQDDDKLIVDMFKDELYLELYDLGRDPHLGGPHRHPLAGPQIKRYAGPSPVIYEERDGGIRVGGRAWIDAGLQYMKLSDSELGAKIEANPKLLRTPLIRSAARSLPVARR